jgi:hypothetical protein
MTKFIRGPYNVQGADQDQTAAWPRTIRRPMTLPVLLLMIVVFTGFAYIFYINRTATGSFEIKALESKITQLQDVNKKLELQTADMQSLSAVEESVKDLQMVAVSRVEYLPAVGAVMAVR